MPAQTCAICHEPVRKFLLEPIHNKCGFIVLVIKKVGNYYCTHCQVAVTDISIALTCPHCGHKKKIEK